MQIAVTGGTGFLGRYLVRQLVEAGHTCRLWCHESSQRGGFEDVDAGVHWVEGRLGDPAAAFRLVERCDAVVHAALDQGDVGYHGVEGDVQKFLQTNLLGTIQLIEEARAAKAPRFVFISSCGVHDVVLDDRPLDETHPLWPATHYGAHKAALEKFVHSYGFGAGYSICAVRPPQIYGLAYPGNRSKWYELVRDVAAGKSVRCTRGGKHVHAADVARAVELLLRQDVATVAGQVYSCYDRYISEYEVARLAREISGSDAAIRGESSAPRHQIVSDKIRALGMEFGGEARLRETVEQLVEAARRDA